MARRKKISFKEPTQPPKKIMDIRPPDNFPALGATISPHAATYFNANGKPDTPKQSRWRDRAFIRKVLKRMILVVVIIILLSGGYVGWKFGRNILKTFGGNLFGLLSSTKLKGEDQGRVTILLAGNSADDPGHQGADLTDSIMIVSVDTVHKTAFLLSVPRDLWVNIPGVGYQKINAAYEYGQAQHFQQAGFPNGGMGLLEQVVNQDFGIPIDYYALVDYSALRDSVNAVGGVTVNIQSNDPRGLYDPSIDYATHGSLVKLTNGVHVLNGEQALDLARARGDAYGSYGFPQADFNRTQNQRLILVALKNKITTVSVLANPIKIGQLFDSIGNNVQTDLKTNEVRRAYTIGSGISNNNIQSIGLNNVNGQNLLHSYYAPDGEDALIPAAGIDNYSAIQALVSQLTAPPATPPTH